MKFTKGNDNNITINGVRLGLTLILRSHGSTWLKVIVDVYANDYYQFLRAQKDRSLIPFSLQDVSKTFQAICTETIPVVID